MPCRAAKTRSAADEYAHSGSDEHVPMLRRYRIIMRRHVRHVRFGTCRSESSKDALMSLLGCFTIAARERGLCQSIGLEDARLWALGANGSSLARRSVIPWFWRDNAIESERKGLAVAIHVFISSTSKDLLEYRQAAIDVCNRLQFVPIGMEFFNAMGPGATEGSKQRIMQSDVYVGIFAYRYGYVEAGYAESVTEIEFQFAGERNIDRLVFPS